jgi:hypothetical protein
VFKSHGHILPPPSPHPFRPFFSRVSLRLTVKLVIVESFFDPEEAERQATVLNEGFSWSANGRRRKTIYRRKSKTLEYGATPPPLCCYFRVFGDLIVPYLNVQLNISMD